MMSDLAANHGVTIFISSHILGEIMKFTTRIGIIHEGILLQELDTNELDKLSRKRLLLNSTDLKAASSTLVHYGYTVSKTENGILEIKDDFAIQKPDKVATILVNAGCPPTLLQVEEEDLESFFLRTIEMKGGAK